jgi:hypothetical protein
MNRIAEKANPDVEFTNDKMMQSLHNIRIKIFKDIEKLDNDGLAKYFKDKAARKGKK